MSIASAIAAEYGEKKRNEWLKKTEGRTHCNGLASR